MKILLLSHIFPPAIDGGSKVIYKIGKYLESKNHQTLYLSSNCFSTDDFVKKSPALSREGFRKGFIKLPVYTNLRKPLKLLNIFLNQDSLKVFQKGPIFKFIPFIKATIQIIKFKPDLIIAGPLPTTIILYANFFKFINKQSKLLINASFHQTDQDFFQKPLIKALKNADYIWALTEYEKTFFIKKLNIDSSKIILAGNGVDSDFIKESLPVKGGAQRAEGFNILFIGSLSAHKKVDLLLKVFDKLSEKYSNLILTIAGQKTLYYPNILNILKNIKNKKRINFIFNFPQKKLIKLIDSSTILVLPSTQESFGLVLIEAWARQKPVLCADIPALKELVKKSNGGLCFKTNSTKDLEQKILTLIKNKDICQKLGQNGYKYVKNNYTWNKVGEKICQKILY